MKKRLLAVLALAIVICTVVTGCQDQQGVTPGDSGETAETNQYTPYTQVTNIDSGMVWPEDQAFPTFATPAEVVDMISIAYFSEDEQLTVTALQGMINKEKPRILLLDNNPDEGARTWPKTDVMQLNTKNYKKAERFDFLQKFVGEVSGVVLYDKKKSVHYRNLASSIAAIEGLLPMEKSVYEDWKDEGVLDLEVKIDITALSYRSEMDIYTYLYDNYWGKAQHRLIVSADPNDCQHVRDMAAATGAIVVWLDCTQKNQRELFDKFLADMTPGQGMVLGWFTTERSGITTVTAHGLSTVPGNFYINSTIYSGTDHTIQIPMVPDKPELENKIYIAVYVSDGDNVQYVERYMRKLWDQSKNDRGKVAINWTISPALVDLGPGLLNYYYTTATEKDCFVSGPSGLGYNMPYNMLNEAGAVVTNFLENEELMTAYVKLTERYLQRSGLRVVTVWDSLSKMQREVYTDNTRYLYGLTVNTFTGSGDTYRTVIRRKLLVQKVDPWYGGDAGSLTGAWSSAISGWDGNSPLFISSQVSVWGSVKPDTLVKLAEEMEERYDGKVEFVRADHYFALYNEANGLPFDLSMSSKLTASATSNNEAVANTVDGTPVSIWEATEQGQQTVTYDLGGTYTLSRYVIRHAGDNGMDQSLNTKSYFVEVSSDGEIWTKVDEYIGNAVNVSDIALKEAVEASFLRITITDAGADGIARIADVEIYGSK